MLRRLFVSLITLGVAAPAACQSVESSAPAVLASGDAENLAALNAALARAMGRARIELGASDPTVAPSVSVLPPPLGSHEDRSTVVPTQFNLILRDGACFAVRGDTGEAFELAGVRCRPYAP
jgi:hypothetical protein